MKRSRISDEHPLRNFFQSLVHSSLSVKLGLEDRDIEDYLCGLVTEYIHLDAIELENEEEEIDDIVRLLERGDVLLKAKNFEQERKVHKMVGDYLLFWAGVFPEHLKQLKKQGKPTGLINPIEQGKFSYHFVSTFEYGDYAKEAALFRKMSVDFEQYVFALHLVREAWENNQGPWASGFEA